MTPVRVLFFATLRDTLDCEALTVDLPTGTFAELRTALEAALADRDAEARGALWSDNVRLALNQEMWHRHPGDAEVVFRSGDEVAFLPPVTGG